MANDSSTGGYLQPTPPVSTTDLTLEDIFQTAIAGVTGLPGALVRPRFQAVTPNQPDFDTNWVAFGLTVASQDQFPHVRHDPALETNGASVVSRDEELELSLSFYGLNNHQYLTMWREGLAIDQNRWALQAHGIKLVSIGDSVNLPALLKERWVRRVDLKCQFQRKIFNTFSVRSIATAGVGIITETGTTTISVNQ